MKLNSSRALFFIVIFFIAVVLISTRLASLSAAQGNPQNSPKDLTDKRTSAKAEASVNTQLDPHVIYLNAGPLNVTTPEAQALRKPATNFTGKRMRLVKFTSAIKPEWHQSLLNAGLQVVDYIPNYTYLVYGDFASVQRLQVNATQVNSPIQWEAEYGAAQRIHPLVYEREKLKTRSGQANAASVFDIQLVQDAAANADTLKLIASLQTAPVKATAAYLHYFNLKVASTLAGVEQLAQRPDVISIQAYLEPKKLDERQDLIVSGNISGNNPATGANYMTWLANKGFTQAQFTTSNFAVDVSDSGVDNASTLPNHFGLYVSGNVANASRVIYNRLEGTPNVGSTLQGCDGHGNINAHIIGGFVPSGAPFNAFPFADAGGYRYGLGVCPFVKVGSSVIFDPNTFTSPNYENLQSKAYNDGVRISSNSWGANTSNYTTDAQRYDALVRDAQPTGSTFPVAGNQEMVIVFAAGNNGSSAGTVGSPSTGKNVITVGASENVHAFGGADQCNTPDSEADSLNDIVGFSSRGPTADGRKKPDIVAPGTHVTGGVAQTAGQRANPPGVANGSANACFDATGVCAGPSGSDFFPLSQQWYTASSGTSHSTPAVAGGAALVRQHFINQGLMPPSPAMTKAVLMNGGRYLRGTGANDTFYSNNQGMGLMDLNRSIDSVTNHLLIRDQLAADVFTATAQTRVFNVTATPNKLMRVTLAWTDAPGSTAGSAARNNLDLRVVNGANTYLGNVFTNNFSVTGGTADALNNVESVYLASSASGMVTITVTATNINSDGIPGNAEALDQDFALIVSETDASALSSLAANGATLTADACNSNGILDAGEQVTVNLGLINSGDGATTNAVGTLLATGGVTNPGAPQTYGVIAGAGGTASRSFTFTVNPMAACGSTLTLSLQVQDGALNLGTFTYTFIVGQSTTMTTVYSENFDGVTAPALPSGWSVQQSGTTPPPAFASTTTTPDTAPNTIFTNGVTTVASNSLLTPDITIPANSTSIQLNFRQTRNFEGTSACFDGGVLELSTNGGASYHNVTSPAIGGSFSAGGYDAIVSSVFSNPLGGQSAWCFAQATYVTSILDLPNTFAGQTVKFRWRAGWDSSVANANPNWRIDTVTLKTRPLVCANCNPTPPTMHKAFGAFSIQAGGSAKVTLTLNNSNASPLTNASFTDLLTNMSAIGGPVTGTCTGTMPAMLSAGATSLSFSGITIPASGSCTVEFDVTSTTLGTHNNVTSGITTTQTPTAGSPSNAASLTVYGAPAIAKSFNPTTITAGGTSTVSLTVTNPNPLGLLAAFSDTLIGMSTVGGPVIGSCALLAPIHLAPNAAILNFTGVILPANGGCTLSFDVRSNSVGAQTNTTSGVTTDRTPTPGNPSNTATLTVNAPAVTTIAKAFDPATIPLGGISTVTLTLTNPNPTGALASFTDNLTGMVAVGGPVGGTCASLAGNTLAANATALSFSGVVVPSNSTPCTVTFAVKGTVAGEQTNTTSGVVTDQTTPNAGPPSNTATLTVVAATVAKSFTPTSIVSGDTSLVTLTLTNNTAPAVLASLTDTLVNMTAVGGPVGGTCASLAGNTLTAGATNLSFDGIVIPANDSCTLTFAVTSTTVGTQPNTTSGVTVNNSGVAGPVSNTAHLTVTSSRLLPLAAKAVRNDFDGDRRSDLANWNSELGAWEIKLISTDATQRIALVEPNDKEETLPVAADFDGDGKYDGGLWHPRDGGWLIRLSSNGELLKAQFGLPGDVPMAADFDGDGKADLALWRNGDGLHIWRSSDQTEQAIYLGQAGDMPVLGDFNGDGLADVAVFHANEGRWLERDTATGMLSEVRFGQAGDSPLAADFDGDGLDDRVCLSARQFRLSFQRSSDQQIHSLTLSRLPLEQPLWLGDFDGDGKSDCAIRSDQRWLMRLSSHQWE